MSAHPSDRAAVSPGPTRSHDTIPSLELLVEVLGGASSEMDGAGFYSHLAEALCRLADMRRAIVFRYDEATHEVVAAGAHGIDLEHFADAHITLALAPDAARALAEDRVVEVRPPAARDIAPEFASLVSDHALVYVPMAAAGRWPGVIIAEPATVEPLDAVRRDLLWTLGKTLALASTARIATFRGERARELQERIDLARDIHDGVAQRVFGVSMALSKGPVAEETRVRCEQELLAALDELRVALGRPLRREVRQTRRTLAEELRRLPAEMPDLELTVEGEAPAVPPALDALFQSVLAEAVRNVRKHASLRTRAVRVRCLRRDGLLVLEVENDGIAGRPPGRKPGMGLRLAALEALQVGGVLEFGERRPGIWQVRLAVPEGPA